MADTPILYYYHAQASIPHENNYSLLAAKVFNRFSTHMWEESRKLSNLSIKRNSITSLRTSLLTPNFATPLRLEDGAFIDYTAYFDNFITTYIQHDAFLLPTERIKTWNFKLSWDNVSIWTKNEAWTLTPMSVLHNQRPIHSHLIMYAHIPERNMPMLRCVVESGLQDFLLNFHEQTFTYRGEEVYPNLFLCADWIGLVNELGAPLPNTSNLFDQVCWRCGVNKQLLRTDWLDDPFHWHDDLLSTSDFPNAVFDEIPLSMRRYCWMHGISNLISNCIIGLHNLLLSHASLSQQFISLISITCPNWTPKKALVPKQMKHFFDSALYKKLSPLYLTTQVIHTLLWPTTPHTFPLTSSQAVAMLLDSCNIFYRFAYTKAPTPHDFAVLHAARACILSCHHTWRWRIAPTTHFLTNHAILDAENDKSAYDTVQEGVEHANHDDKEESRITFKAATPSNKMESRSEHLINQQQLRITLTKLGYAAPPYNLESTINYSPIHSEPVLTYPIYAPSSEL